VPLAVRVRIVSSEVASSDPICQRRDLAYNQTAADCSTIPRRSAKVSRSILFAFLGATLFAASSVAGSQGAGTEAAAAETKRVPSPPAKTQTAAGLLLLPFFESNFQPVDGIETLFSVRNQDTQPVDITISYFEVNRPTVAQLTESITLAPKQTSTHIIRLKNVIRDDEGFARGYALIRAERPVITGDYFQVNDGENFAAGDRLVNADPSSTHIALCRRYTMRAFTGGSFNGGTTFTFFVDSDVPLDGETPVASYTVYDEPGNVVFIGSLFSDALAFRLPAANLGSIIPVPDFAAIEFEFNETVGHVWAQMSGAGRVSVGLNGSCGDVAPASN